MIRYLVYCIEYIGKGIYPVLRSLVIVVSSLCNWLWVAIVGYAFPSQFIVEYSDWFIFLSIFVPGVILLITGAVWCVVSCFIVGFLFCIGSVFYAATFGGS